jgi:hypothetical protein
MVRLWIGCVPEHHHRVAYELVHGSAFGQESLRQRGEIARCLTHEYVGISGLGNGRKIPNVGEHDRNLFSSAAKLSGDRVIDHSPDDLLGNEVRERPDGALREIDGAAKFVNFLDVGGDRRRVGRSQFLQRSAQ